MSKKKKIILFVMLFVLFAALIIGVILTDTGGEKHETVKEVMKDAVLHENSKISLFGLVEVNPGYLSSCIVVIALLVTAACIRIFATPKFKIIPGKFQMLLEKLVGTFDGMAKTNSPHRNSFLGAYIFAAGTYIFVGTIFELFGIQGITTDGYSISLPAPLADINGAISLGCISYLSILSGGIIGNGFKGIGSTLKDFSLPISMSFRLFGALLSGALVTELVYYYLSLSFVLPVFVGVLFTLLHALIQAYVLTMLTAVFYGEVSKPGEKKKKKKQTENKIEDNKASA